MAILPLYTSPSIFPDSLTQAVFGRKEPPRRDEEGREERGENGSDIFS